MEEDIKTLEEILKDIKADKNKACYVDRDSLIFPIIENLIARNKELEYKLREHICIEAHEQVKQLYIPKSKVRELLNKLEISDDLEAQIAIPYIRELLKERN